MNEHENKQPQEEQKPEIVELKKTPEGKKIFALITKIDAHLHQGDYQSALKSYLETLNAYQRIATKLEPEKNTLLYTEIKNRYEQLEEFRNTYKKTETLHALLQNNKDPASDKKNLLEQAEGLHKELLTSKFFGDHKQREEIEKRYAELANHPVQKPSEENAPEKKKIKKYKTEIPGFDELFSEGMPEASSILLEGGPGSGKTIFCLQLIYNACKQGRKVLYMSFEEPEERLREHMRAFGWQPDEFEQNGLMKITRFNALDIARSVEALLSEAKKELLIEVQPMLFPKEFQPEFLIIDSLSAIASAFSGEESRFRIYMEQLFRYLEKMNITTILIREVANPTHTGYNYVEAGEAVSFLSDGIIIVYNVIYPNGTRGSAIEILKMRGEAIDRRIVKMEIQNKKGIIVYPNQQLTGNYRLT